MRIESSRTLILPISPEQAWEALVDPAELRSFVPELDDAWPSRTGAMRLQARVGRRRRSWRAQVAHTDPGRHVVLESVTPGVNFHFEATLEPHAEGCVIKTVFRLEPPARWLARPRPIELAKSRVFERLVVSTALFAVAVIALVSLPSAGLSRTVAALAYAVLGAVFLAAVALLSGTHRRQQAPNSDDGPESLAPPPKEVRLRA